MNPLLNPAAGEAARVPTVAEGMRVFKAVEAVVRGDAKGDPAVDAMWRDLPAVRGCAVVLRLEGEVVGRGSVLLAPGSVPDSACIGAALRNAWGEVELRVPTPLAVEDVEADGLRRARALRSQIALSLELAGPLMEVRCERYGDLDDSLAAGIDGVAAVLEGKVGVVFPGTAITGSVAASEAARRAVGMAAVAARGPGGGGSTYSLIEPADLEKKHGVKVYRFRVTHLAQARADVEPALLYRGQRLVEQTECDDAAELWSLADSLATNLMRRVQLNPAGGTLSVATGEVGASGAFELALARQALHEYWVRREPTTRGTDGAAFTDRARKAADAYLTASRRGMGTATEADALAARGLIMHNPISKGMEEERFIAEKLVNDRLAVEVPAGLRGVVMLGWTYIGSPNRARAAVPGERLGDTQSHGADNALRALMAETSVTTLATEMPFLGWAELEIDRQLKRPAGKGSATALREMRTLVWKHQLGSVEAGPDAQDMVGGIVVPGSKRPLPTWQTARLVAFLATMLGEPELTSKEERGREVVRLVSAARFLRQLQVDETLEWMCKDPAAARGGLRNAVWDQRSQTDATAMALLAVLEMIGSIERVSEGE